jgi:DNA-binding response OmpR family regulator
MKTRRILVIEDDAAIRRGVVDALRFARYETLEADTGKKGLEMGLRVDCDLVLLDLVLPGVDGLSILESVRAARPTLPVIVLTARGEEADRVKGLGLGADDYVVKPFSVKELLARVEAVLRRSAERPVDVASVTFPGGVADIARLEVRYKDGTRVLAGGNPRARLEDRPQRRGHAHDRHARRPPSGEAARRPVFALCRRDRER